MRGFQEVVQGEDHEVDHLDLILRDMQPNHVDAERHLLTVNDLVADTAVIYDVIVA